MLIFKIESAWTQRSGTKRGLGRSGGILPAGLLGYLPGLGFCVLSLFTQANSATPLWAIMARLHALLPVSRYIGL